MRLALLSGLFSISILLSQGAYAKSQLDAATLKKLTMMEQKFFAHTYDAETDEDRTKRIEKLIYGTASEGDVAGRVNKLASVTYLDNRPDQPPAPVASQSAPTSVATQPVPAPIAKPQSKPAPTPIAHANSKAAEQYADDDSDVPPSKSGKDDYPHVTALEKEILGTAYVGQPLSGRIVRMENKAFGAPSKSTDLGERTDELETYAQKKLHAKPFLADEQADTVYETADGGMSNSPDQGQQHHQLQSAYPHVTALENEILGQAYPDLPLANRLAALETKAFGHASTSDDMSSRTDALERYAEKSLHKKPFGSDPGYETADGGGAGGAPKSKSDKLVSMVENTLMNMVGIGGLANGGANAGSMMPGSMGFGGMGPGNMMTGPGGFSGIRVRRRQAQPQQNEPSAAEEPSGPVEDPAVRAKTPPPPGTRLATRVGWCEMQVFGHTSPTMHLAERLSSLNRELNFMPGKSSMELMDHIDGLVKSAQAFKAPAYGVPESGTPVAAGSSKPASGTAVAAGTPKAGATAGAHPAIGASTRGATQ